MGGWMDGRTDGQRRPVAFYSWQEWVLFQAS